MKVKLSQHLQHVDNKNVHFRFPEPEWLQSDTASKEEMIVKLQPYVPGIKIYYTLDGSDPITHSNLYQEPFRINIKSKATVRLNIIQVTPSGITCLVYSVDYARGK